MLDFTVFTENGRHFVVTSFLDREADGYEYSYSFSHDHEFDYDDLAAAQRLCDRITEAGLTPDHLTESPHWVGGGRMTYQSFCEGFARGELHEDGRLLGNRRSQHY